MVETLSSETLSASCNIVCITVRVCVCVCVCTSNLGEKPSLSVCCSLSADAKPMALNSFTTASWPYRAAYIFIYEYTNIRVNTHISTCIFLDQLTVSRSLYIHIDSYTHTHTHTHTQTPQTHTHTHTHRYHQNIPLMQWGKAHLICCQEN
jgi:hypothetical protein